MGRMDRCAVRMRWNDAGSLFSIGDAGATWRHGRVRKAWLPNPPLTAGSFGHDLRRRRGPSIDLAHRSAEGALTAQGRELRPDGNEAPVPSLRSPDQSLFALKSIELLRRSRIGEDMTASDPALAPRYGSAAATPTRSMFLWEGHSQRRLFLGMNQDPWQAPWGLTFSKFRNTRSGATA